MVPIFFSNELEFRNWLQQNHLIESELIVGFYKVHTKKASISWSQSVDQALCFGWIDGVRRSIDSESYSIRFTPRKKGSIWSAINIKKMGVLTKEGLITASGEMAFERRTEERSAIYSHEKELSVLDSAYEVQFKDNPLAWDFFNRQAASYKKAILHWIMTAKQEKTRTARLQKTIALSAAQKRVL